jgi:hypothetical protein
LQTHFARPDNAFIAPAKGCSNLLVGWPTKLTLAPNLANQALELLAQAGIKPGAKTAPSELPKFLSKPLIAPTPWELAFPATMSAEEQLMLKLQEELVEAYDETMDEPYGVDSFALNQDRKDQP